MSVRGGRSRRPIAHKNVDKVTVETVTKKRKENFKEIKTLLYEYFDIRNDRKKKEILKRKKQQT